MEDRKEEGICHLRIGLPLSEGCLAEMLPECGTAEESLCSQLFRFYHISTSNYKYENSLITWLTSKGKEDWVLKSQKNEQDFQVLREA